MAQLGLCLLANFEVVNHLLNQGEAKAADVMGTTLVPHIILASKLLIIKLKQRPRRLYLKDNDGNGYHLEGYVQIVKCLSHFGPMET